jgi:hypothetical protein
MRYVKIANYRAGNDLGEEDLKCIHRCARDPGALSTFLQKGGLFDPSALRGGGGERIF